MSEQLSDVRRLRLAKGLRSMIPGGFPCTPGCFSCCKVPVQILRVEWEAIRRLPVAQAIVGDRMVNELTRPGDTESVRISDDRGWCPFVLESGACGIYDERPVTCRVYAQSPIMRCTEGVKCPPASEVPLDVIRKWGRLGNKDDLGGDPVAAEAYMVSLEEWRETFKKKPDAMPSREDDKHIGVIFERIVRERRK